MIPPCKKLYYNLLALVFFIFIGPSGYSQKKAPLTRQGLEAIISSDWSNASEKDVDSLLSLAADYRRKYVDLSIQLTDITTKKAIEIDYQKGIAKAHLNRANVLLSLSQMDSAIVFATKAQVLFKELNDNRYIGSTYQTLGNIYYEMALYQDALNQLGEAIKYQSKIEDNFLRSQKLSSSFMNKGIMFKEIWEKGESENYYDSSIFYLKQSLDIRKEIKDTRGIGASSLIIGRMYLANTSYDTALQYFETTKTIREEMSDYAGLGHVYNSIGLAYSGKRQFGLAEANLKRALGYADSVESKPIKIMVYGSLAQMEEERNDYEKALDYAHLYFNVVIERFREQREDQILRIQKQQQIELNEREIELIKKDQEISNYILIILAITLISIIIISILAVRYLKRKKEMSEQIFRNEIELKNKEIASYTMSFLQKNQLMEELKEQINQLKKSSDVSTNKELTRINRIVDNTFRSDEEWKTFQITFDQMHDGFFTDLKVKFPDITNSELKLCALLRLNMNLKESSKILGIAPDSVKTARYRLRKKLGLKTEENLVDFLMRFEDHAV